MQNEQLQFISVERIPDRPRMQTCQNIPIRSSKIRKKRKRRRYGTVVFGTALVLLVVLVASRIVPLAMDRFLSGSQKQKIEKQKEILEAGGESYPDKLLEMLENNEETLNFVEGYGERAKWLEQEIDLSGEVTSGKVPLLLQWDRRWGYDAYGNGMIGWTGCGPVCMTMAYLYLTNDTSMDPRKMAAFADQNGYNSDQGTNWDFWTSGAAALGLKGEELSLSEGAMRAALDEGGLIVCSMRPGDFTTTGHFILIRGYDEKGFYVNDPNRRSNSEKQWSFDTLQGQIKNLWGIYQG